MMIARTIFICVSLLVLSAALHAQTGDPENWMWAFSTYSSGQNSYTVGAFGVASGASDGYGSQENDWRIVSGSKVYFGTYHVNGLDNWLGQTGFYSSDTRAAMPLVPGWSNTWTVYVWADPSLPAAPAFFLDWDNYHTLPGQISFALCLVAKPVGITGGPAVGTIWNLSAQPHGEVQLPVFRTSDGREGYVFDFTATVIPEPSSLLALLTGLAGLGTVLRRRS